MQAALGTLTVACVFVMAREWFGRRAAWIAGALATLCGVLTFYEVLILQASIDGVLTAAALAVAVLLFVIRRPRLAAWMTCGILLGLAPVSARNIVVAGRWSLVSSHGGLNFFIGNNETATGLYQLVPGIRPEIDGQREDTTAVAEQAVGHALDDSEVSSYFMSRGLNWIRAQPADAARLMAKKLFLAFHADHAPLPQSYAFFAEDAETLLRWMPVNPWLIVPLGLAGLLWAAPLGARREFLVWASFVPAYAVAVAVFFVAERYRLPLLVPLTVGAGALVDRAVGARRPATIANTPPSPRWLGLAAATATALVVLVNWPMNITDGRGADRARMALKEAERGRYDQAESWMDLATRLLQTPEGARAVSQVSPGRPARHAKWGAPGRRALAPACNRVAARGGGCLGAAGIRAARRQSVRGERDGIGPGDHA